MKPLAYLIFLFAAILSHAQSFIGYGDCMMPALFSAERLYVAHADYEDLKPGDLVAFIHQPNIVASRLVALTPDGWMTRAESNVSNDEGLMTKAAFLGTIAGTAQKHTDVKSDGRNWYILYPDNRDYWTWGTGAWDSAYGLWGGTDCRGSISCANAGVCMPIGSCGAPPVVCDEPTDRRGVPPICLARIPSDCPVDPICPVCPNPPPAHVPEGGMTFWLLGICICGLFAARLRLTR